MSFFLFCDLFERLPSQIEVECFWFSIVISLFIWILVLLIVFITIKLFAAWNARRLNIKNEVIQQSSLTCDSIGVDELQVFECFCKWRLNGHALRGLNRVQFLIAWLLTCSFVVSLYFAVLVLRLSLEEGGVLISELLVDVDEVLNVIKKERGREVKAFTDFECLWGGLRGIIRPSCVLRRLLTRCSELKLSLETFNHTLDSVFCVADEQVLSLLHSHRQLCFDQLRLWILTGIAYLHQGIFLRLHVDVEKFKDPDRNACSQTKLFISEAEWLLCFAPLGKVEDVLRIILLDEDLVHDLAQISIHNRWYSELRLIDFFLPLCNNLSIDQPLTLRSLMSLLRQFLSRVGHRGVRRFWVRFRWLVVFQISVSACRVKLPLVPWSGVHRIHVTLQCQWVSSTLVPRRGIVGDFWKIIEIALTKQWLVLLLVLHDHVHVLIFICDVAWVSAEANSCDGGLDSDLVVFNLSLLLEIHHLLLFAVVARLNHRLSCVFIAESECVFLRELW